MKINIKNLKGEVFSVEAEPNQSVAQLKQTIEQAKGYAVDDQKIIFKGKTIPNQDTIQQMGLAQKDFLVIMVKVAKPVSKPAPKKEEKKQEPKKEEPKKEEPMKGNAEAEGGERAAKVTQLMSMGFSKEQCEAALTAAFNDSDRAVEYLINGIPQIGGQEVGPEQELAIPMSPEDLEVVARVREQVREDPDSLPNILGELAQSHPNLYALIAEHPQEFEEMVMGDEGMEMEAEEGEEGGIVVSEGEDQAITRLAGLGFSKIEAAQAFMACDKNEELAANLLFERLANGDIEQVPPGYEEEEDEDDLFN